MKHSNTSLRKFALCLGLLIESQFPYQVAFSEPNPSSSNTPELEAEVEELSEIQPNLPIKKTNDPFANTMEMLKKVTQNNPVASTISALTGSMDMRLRGAVIDDEGNSLALLEIADGQVHVVKVGDTLSLKTHGKNSSVKIMSIHRQSVELEFGDFEEFVVVR